MKMWKRNLIICWFGMFITGALMLIAFITTVLFVKEDFTREDKKRLI